jgi:nicotinate-nucleotide adenylyltransferase
MDVGLFGGSFNPPHVAHQIVAETVREQFALDAVWWMPAGTPPHKEAGVVAAAPHRLEMARRATASNPGFEVRGEEVERDGPSYTIETLRVLEARHPEARFALVIGGDSLASFSAWRAPVQIARRAELLVYRRPGDAGGPEALLADLPEEVARRVRFAEAPSLAVAGTDLRERRRQGRSLRYLVPEAVRTYIHEHDLYAGEARPAVAG